MCKLSPYDILEFDVDHIFNDHQLRNKFQVTEDVTDVETGKDGREKLITVTNDVTEDYREI